MPAAPADDLREDYAELYPTGLWTEACEVRCACGFSVTVPTCREAQQVARAHDVTHQKEFARGRPE